MEPDTISYHETRIAALEQDIKFFGAAGDDLERLHRHRIRLQELQAREP